MNDQVRIFLAEDEVVTASIITDVLESNGWQVVSCEDGREAWEMLQSRGHEFDVILLDRGLPNIDGMELMQRAKGLPALMYTPVILETALSDEQSICDGLMQGAYYYLTKPLQPEVLLAVVRAAVQQSRDLRGMLESLQRSERPLALLQEGTFRFRDLDDCTMLARYLASACPQPERVVRGLRELLINAVEHGNLEISYHEKAALVLAGQWDAEVERRLRSPRWRDRYAEVALHRNRNKLTFTVRDQGPGFAWQSFLDFSSERAFDPNGRGIAIARQQCFDALDYQDGGRCVNAVVALTEAG